MSIVDTNSSFIDHFQTANQLFRARQFAKAIPFYQKAIAQSPAFYALYENLGDALLHLNHLAEAEAAYQQAIDLNPNSAWPYAQIGQIKAQQSDNTAAVAAHRRAIQLAPGCPAFYHRLKQVLLAQGNAPEAGKTLQRLGAILREQGSLTAAITAYQEALSLNPTLTAAHQALGECWQRQGEFSAAAACYQAVSQHLGANQHLWFYKTWGEALLQASSQTSGKASSQTHSSPSRLSQQSPN